MKVYQEVTNEIDFNFYGEARHTIEHLTFKEQEQVIETLEGIYPDGISATQLNDIFAFDRDFIAKCLGFRDWEELLENENDI